MNIELQYFIKQLISGLSLGSMYALIAVGYSMVYSMLYLINFAHGDLYIFGTFLVLACLNMGMPVMGAVILGACFCGLIAMGIEKTVYRPVRGSNRIVPMVGAMGASLILRTAAQLIWGASQIVYPSLIPGRLISLGNGLWVNQENLIILAVGVFSVGVLTFVINHTKLGKASKCVMQDLETASLMGININAVVALIYFLGGALGTAGGVLMSSYYTVINIEMGLWGTCKAWAAAQLGGVGSLKGAFLGGMILGVGETMAATYLGAAYKDVVGYVMIVVVLVFMPNGLLGKKKTVKV